MIGPSSPANVRRGRSSVIALLVCLAVATVLLLDTWPDPSRRLAGVPWDPEQSSWGLAWTRWALAHHTSPWVTTAIGQPHVVNLTWSGVVGPLWGVIGWPFTALGEPVLAYNALLLSALALSGWVTVLMHRRFVTFPVALGGGVLFELSPYIQGQALGHVNLVLVVAPQLLTLLALDLWSDRRSARRTGILAGVIVGVQFLLAEEMLAITLVAGLIAGLALTATGRPVMRHARASCQALLWMVPTAAVLMVYPLLVQLAGPARPHGPIPAGDAVTDVVNWVVPTQVQAIRYGQTMAGHFTASLIEATGYIGLPLLALAVAGGVRQWERLHVRVIAITGLALAVLSLGGTLHVGGARPGLPLPWGPLEHLPIVQDLVVGRFSAIVDLCIVGLVSVFVDNVRRRRRPAALLACLVASLTWLPPVPLAAHAADAPAWFANPSGSVVLVLPFAHGGNDARAMLWQARSGIAFSMPDGYYIGPHGPDGSPGKGPNTPLARTLAAVQQDDGAAPLPDVAPGTVRRWILDAGVDTVVLGPGGREERRLTTWLPHMLGCPGQAERGVTVWHRRGGSFCP